MTSEIEHQAFIAMQYNPPAPTLDYPDAVVAGARAVCGALGFVFDNMTAQRQESECRAFADGLEAYAMSLHSFGDAGIVRYWILRQTRTTGDAA